MRNNAGISQLVKLYEISRRADKRRFFIVCLASLILAIVEAAMVLTISLASKIFTGEEGSSNFFGFDVISLSREFNLNNYLVSIIVAVIVLKLLISVGLIWVQGRFIYDFVGNVAHRLFQRYNALKFDEFNDRASSTILRNIVTETNLLAGVLKALMIISVEAVVLVALLCVFVLREFKVALVFICASLLLFFLHKFLIKNRLARWGIERQASEGHRVEQIKNLIDFKKDILVFKKMGFVQRRFAKYNAKTFYLGRLQNFFENFNRPLVEILVFSCIGISALVLTAEEDNISDLIASFVLFIAIAFRLMPSVVRLAGAFQRLSYSKAAVDVIFSDLSADDILVDFKRASQNEGVALRHAAVHGVELKFEGVWFRHAGDDSVIVVPDFTVRAGLPTLLVGQSGAGKSTVLDLACGLLSPAAGVIEVSAGGHQLEVGDIRCGYVPQHLGLINGSILENICFDDPGENVDVAIVEELCRLCEIDQFINLDEGELHLPVGVAGTNFSGGQRQRILIARALYSAPDLLVMDEPTSALDEESEFRVIQNILINFKHIPIIMVSHSRQLSRLDFNIVEIGKGR